MSFVPHMEAFIKDIGFRIILVEQADAKPFNKGRLLNIGFTLARERARWICFHDIDMLPDDDSCDYSFPPRTTHLAGRLQQYGYKLPYPEYLGGVLLTTRTDFEKINGFSNEYWGWGSEDDDLFVRFMLADVKIDRKPGLYTCLSHKPGRRSTENAERLIRNLAFAAGRLSDPMLVGRIKRTIEISGPTLPHWRIHNREAGNYRSDGLSSLKFELVSRRPLKEVIQFDSAISGAHEVVTVNL